MALVQKATKVHGNKYDYSKSVYINSKTKVIITCNEHGDFLQTPNSHLSGQGCPECAKKRFLYYADNFISRSRKIHNDKYDYTLVKYVNASTKVEIICKKHGSFMQLPTKHLSGAGCIKCANEKCSELYKDSLDTFVEKATKVHGNKYEYSKSVYINSKTKVEIICKKHGSFMQLPTTHLSGANCPKCNKEDRKLKLTKTTEEFIKEANKIHNNVYDYTLVEYVNASTKVDIICKLHGKFSQAPNVHTSMKHGCPECGKIKMGKSHRLSNEEFLSKSKKVHKGEIIPLEVYNNATAKMLFHCNICDNDFHQKSNNHLNGSGCPVCRESKGSKRIRDYLKSNNISFEMEKRFPDCRGSKLPLPFDYYLCDYNTLVEFDGIQHYEMTYFSGNLTKKECELRLSNYQKHDKIKDNYCIEKGIKLIRIPYWELDNIDSILQLKLY